MLNEEEVELVMRFRQLSEADQQRILRCVEHQEPCDPTILQFLLGHGDAKRLAKVPTPKSVN